MKTNFRRILLIVLLVFLVAGLFLAVGCAKKDGSDGKSKQLYTCGMHPQVIRDKPGLCPICNMKLVPMNLTGSASTSETPAGERKILYWTDPMMKPPYISDKPGKSPMGMDLVPVYEDQVSGGAGVTIDPAVIQNIGVRYAQVAHGPLEKTIRAPAHVDFNEDHLAVLSVRAEGWIEKLYIKTPGVSVKAGQPLFGLYSPKLYSAQEEYRIAIRSGDTILANAARERLRLLGISDAEINSIKSKGTKRTLAINSPIDGVVVYVGSSSAGTASQAGASSSGSGMSGMSGGGGGSSGGATGMNSQSGATIREGDFVAAGTAVFTIADLSSLWVYAHIFEGDLPYVKIGMKALLELDYLPGEKFEGEVDFIYPFLDKQTRDIKLRMTIQNPDGKLMPEMYGKVSLESKISEDALIIPSEAVLYSGDRRIVFISLSGGRFIPQDVVLGPSDGKGNVQVISGLYEGQTVVTSAQFLIDSEARLKEALNKMMAEKTSEDQVKTEETESSQKSDSVEEKNNVHDHEAMKDEDKAAGEEKSKEKSAQTEKEEWPNLAPDNPKAKFRCPMPEDRYYAESEGECPICGMKLEPHDPVEWAKEHAH